MTTVLFGVLGFTVVIVVLTVLLLGQHHLKARRMAAAHPGATPLADR